MFSRLLKFGTLVVLAAVAGIAIFFHWQNTRLRERIARLPRRTESVNALRVQNERLRTFLSGTQSGGADAGQAMRKEMERMRGEVTKLEQHAELRHAQLAAQTANDAASLASNRDPQRGLVRLENFQNVGQATPNAACQTLVWAALKGDEVALEKLLYLSGTARAKAETILANLPQAAQADWTPEKLAALVFSGIITDVPAAEITGEETIDSQHATVSLRIPGVATAKSRLNFQLGATGWQVVVTEEQIAAVQRRMAAAIATPPTK